MNRLAALALFIAGVVHLLPAPGILGADRLQALYGIALDDPNLVILLRHRAVLFALLGLFLIAAAFRPGWRAVALLAGYASVLSFLALALSAGSYSTQLGRVVWADVIALACLLAATWAQVAPRWRQKGGRPPA